jgi:hypothetical protein
MAQAVPPPPNPNRLSRRYMGLLKAAAAQAKDDAALGAKVRALLTEYEAERERMIAGMNSDQAVAKMPKADACREKDLP